MNVKRVLVVDDDSVFQLVTRDAFRGLGVHLEFVETPEAALLAASAEFFDAIFVDYCLTSMSGAEVGRRLREEGYGGFIYCLTAMPRHFIEDGSVFADILEKPLVPARLKALSLFLHQ